MQYTADTLFVDQCSKFMFIYNQVSLGAGEILTGNMHLNLHFSPLIFRCRTITVIIASLPLKLSKMIVMTNNKKLPLQVLVITIKMELQNAQFRL